MKLLRRWSCPIATINCLWLVHVLDWGEFRKTCPCCNASIALEPTTRKIWRYGTFLWALPLIVILWHGETTLTFMQGYMGIAGFVWMVYGLVTCHPI